MQKNNKDYVTSEKKQNIEELATAIAERYSNQSLLNLEVIADAYGLTYSYGDYGNDFDGMLEHSFGEFHIYINIKDDYLKNTPRTRFTFAHELGHYFIDHHRNALAQGLVISHYSITGFISENLVEREADFFASCLLLPKKKIITECFRIKLSFEQIVHLSKKFQTSITATVIRFVEVKVYSLMIVYSNSTSILWQNHTEDFPFWKLKYGKTKVPENTAVWEYYTVGRKYKSSEIVNAEDWFDLSYDNEKEKKFLEHCIYENNGNVLSIIWEKNTR
jgi:Zn-dependent peptidase ImmA (M78 family)